MEAKTLIVGEGEEREIWPDHNFKRRDDPSVGQKMRSGAQSRGPSLTAVNLGEMGSIGLCQPWNLLSRVIDLLVIMATLNALALP